MRHNQGDQYSQREKRERKGQKVHLQKLWLKTFLTMGLGRGERKTSRYRKPKENQTKRLQRDHMETPYN